MKFQGTNLARMRVGTNLARALFVGGLALSLAACNATTSTQSVGLPSALGHTRAASPATASMIFDDEFSGTTLDPTKWNTCYWWASGNGCTNGGNLEREWYTPDNISVHDGYLDLVALQQEVEQNYPYTSGMVSTNDCCGHGITFQFQYGYMEMSAQLPPGKGMWPAFWLVPADHTWPPEIDAMEWQGQDPRTNFLTIHWGSSKNPQQSGGSFVGPNLSKGFHTFGLDWEAKSVTWYQDGKAVRTYTDAKHIPHVPMIVIVNLAIGGWLGFPNKKTVFPAHMLVDYVRVWNAYPY